MAEEKKVVSLKAVILCGGQGSRIRDAGEALPKPMLPIGGKPIVWHIMRTFAHFGVREFVLCLGYKGWSFKEYFLNYRAMSRDLTIRLGDPSKIVFHGRDIAEDWSVTLAETGEDTMTGGRVAAIRRHVDGDEPFLLTYGDGVADLDVRALLDFHRRHGRIATITAVHPPGRFGEMQLSGDLVREFNEKPQTTEGLINGGFMVLDPKRIWPYLEGGSDLVLEREPLQKLARDEQLAAFPHTGFWQPMDTLREYTLLNDLWTKGVAPWKQW